MAPGSGMVKAIAASEQSTASKELISNQLDSNRWVYPATVALVYLAWGAYMFTADAWGWFMEHWIVSVTMVVGSFIAGATAEGGAAVAFPVFTKALSISAADARTFGLMIQSAGMTAAGVFIWANRIPVLGRVIVFATLGGAIGQFLGAYYLVLPLPYPKIVFTFVSTVFGLALFISRWWLKWEPNTNLHDQSARKMLLFFGIGIVGGWFASQTRSGIDMLTFILLTLAFGINEKISTPTTVVIMGLNSVVGFFIHGALLQDIGYVWELWMVCVPIVIIGAPMGAWAASRIKRDSLIIFLLSLITLELVTTIWLVPFSNQALVVTAVGVLICIAAFALMLRYRRRHVPVATD